MELWDIYDENKQRTGRTMKHNDWNMKPGEFHLTVLAVIQRTDGKFLITRRRMDKAWAAGWWEVPGGGVRAGESSEEAIIREVSEETGLDISSADKKLALTYCRINPEEKDNYFVDVYRIRLDFQPSDVQIQPSEVMDFAVASAEEIKEYAVQGIFLHYDSIKQVFENNI
ncbi:MAG: NUDIX domain-containing protein [Acutalibacteraceae bacterium]